MQGEGVSMSARSAAKVAAARRNSMKLLESASVDEDFKNTGGRKRRDPTCMSCVLCLNVHILFLLTVSYMCRIGTEHKKGFLMKQGKFIGR